MAKKVKEPTQQELDNFIGSYFKLDRDRGYTYAYHIFGWELPGWVVSDREDMETLAKAMMIAQESHGLSSLECVVNCSDTPILGVRLYGKERFLEECKVLKKLQKKELFPSIDDREPRLDYSANNETHYTTLVYGKYMSRDAYDALREGVEKWPAGLEYHEIDQNQDVYEEGAVGFDVSFRGYPTKRSFTAWDKGFEKVAITDPTSMSIW